MTLLTTLKLVSAQPKMQMSPAMHRRNKLGQKLLEQIELAKALQEGRIYAPTKTKTITNEDGQRVAIESVKRVKAWWWAAANGKLNLSIKYGAKVVDLAKGKNAVEVANLAQVIETLELINQAVYEGELDAAIEAVSGSGKKLTK